MGLFKKDDNTTELIALITQLLAVRAENADLREKVARIDYINGRFIDPSRLLYDGGMKELIRHGLACEFHAHTKTDVRVEAARAALIELISLLKYIPDDVIKGASAAAAVDRQLERDKNSDSDHAANVATAQAIYTSGHITAGKLVGGGSSSTQNSPTPFAVGRFPGSGV